MTATADRDDKGLGLPTKQQTRKLEDMRATLQAWMQSQLPAAEALVVTDIDIPSGSGLANETVMFDARWLQDKQAVTGGYVARIETPDPLFPGTSAQQQYRINRVLADAAGVPVPAMLGYEGDNSILGAPFYVMERIPGRVPADDPPHHHSGWVTELASSERASMFQDAVRVMANLHKVDAGAFDFLNPDGAIDGLRQSLDYYINEFDRPINEPHRVIDAGRQWLLDHYPGNPGLALAWGDARVGNMIFAEGKCRAVLDWDMVCLAGPETDLAWWACFDQTYTVCYGIPRLSGMGTPQQMIELWEQHAGRRVRDFDWHLVFAFYKSAVIVRRLARMLKKSGLLPAGSEHLEFNNPGMQYLASFLELPSDHPVDMRWPGLGNGPA
jgi:aminoglycoside phosphotransferase (APT) family kinase protein